MKKGVSGRPETPFLLTLKESFAVILGLVPVADPRDKPEDGGAQIADRELRVSTGPRDRSQSTR